MSWRKKRCSVKYRASTSANTPCFYVSIFTVCGQAEEEDKDGWEESIEKMKTTIVEAEEDKGKKRQWWKQRKKSYGKDKEKEKNKRMKGKRRKKKKDNDEIKKK